MNIEIEALQKRFADLPGEAGKASLAALKTLLDEHKTAISELPPEMITALLAKHLVPVVKLNDLTDDDPIELHDLQMELLAKHGAALKVTATLQKNQSQHIAELENAIKGFALKIGPVIGAFAVKAALGG